MHPSADVASLLLSLDLQSSGWDGSIEPYPGINLKQFTLQHLRRSFVKKFTGSRQSVAADNRALEKFLECNRRCLEWNPESLQMTSWEAEAFGEAKAVAYDLSFNHDSTESILNLTRISRGFAIGPGSSIGAASEDLYSKLAISKMTCCSQGLRELFAHCLVDDPLWLLTERYRAANVGSLDVRGSRLSFVPKQADISRTICTEPLLNMIFQKGIGSVLEKQLVRLFGINLSEQPDRNRYLAQLGSLTQGFGTIDLASASDSISTRFVDWFFPRQLTSWLKLSRSPITILPDGSEVELHMISSMGNAFTFPLQTIIFSCLVYGAYRVLGITPANPRGHSPGNFAVFGDDIVVDKRAYKLVCRLLELSGFRVNVDKSFNEGPFRESCGSDYFLGHDVRGVYLKHLRDTLDCYSAINRLTRWSARHGVFLPLTVQYLRSGVKDVFVPYAESDDAGIKVPESFCRRLKRIHGLSGSIYYRYTRIRPNRRQMPADESKSLRLPGYFYSGSGMLLAFLAGSIRNGSVTLRNLKKRRTELRWRVTPCWDYIPPDEGVSLRYCSEWQFAAEANLTF